MKKHFSILFFIILSSFSSFSQDCSYTLELKDEGYNSFFGGHTYDGWTWYGMMGMSSGTNAYVDVTINGTTTSYTIESVSGDSDSSASYTINVTEGDSAVFHYRIVDSDGADENSWSLYDGTDISINHTDGETDATYTRYCKMTILPVEFIDANYDCNSETLKWITASEINNDHFTIITGSIDDDGDFIASSNTPLQIDGNGNTNSISHYNTNVETSDKYIQLWQTDYDGKEKLLDLIFVKCPKNKEQNIVLYPNPVQSGQNIIISVPNFDKNSLLYVNNISGQTILSAYAINNDRIELDGNLFNSGIYIISIMNKGEIINKKLIVR